MTLILPPVLSEILSAESSPIQRLLGREQFWAESYEFLLSRGYQLRPRYHPEWVPSWGLKRNPFRHECDDFLTSYSINTLDARCIRDNQKVVLKRVNGKELEIFQHLDALRSDARNHTIPLLDVISFPGTEWTFVVMPYCRLFNSPPFHCRDEFVDAMTRYIEKMNNQRCGFTLEGHQQNNVLCSAHRRRRIWSSKNRASFRKARTVQYYYIDFGLSKHFPGGKESARLTSTLRTFPMIPELSLTVPYNPFYVDVFQLGLAMSRTIDNYPALEDFRIVATSLTVDDPHARATLENASKQLNCVRDQMSPSLRPKRIWEKGITRWQKVTRVVFGGQWS
ncbi:hypothetical protein C8R43DRAFT_1101214 [Mycena crocata]|nr:hypothetical protein C8R43DRAFT_1101214 [Mycena crocata]